MSITITERELDEALAEIEQVRKAKAAAKTWSDELFDFVAKAVGNPNDRSPRASYDDIADILVRRGWYECSSGNALSQAYRRERRRRMEAVDG